MIPVCNVTSDQTWVEERRRGYSRLTLIRIIIGDEGSLACWVQIWIHGLGTDICFFLLLDLMCAVGTPCSQRVLAAEQDVKSKV